jgi:hypothetical protein
MNVLYFLGQPLIYYKYIKTKGSDVNIFFVGAVLEVVINNIID